MRAWNLFTYVFGLVIGLLILLIVGNALLSCLFFVKDRYFRQNPVMARYGEETVLKAYPNKNVAEVKKLLDETWYRPMVSESLTGFTEAPFTGTYVNVTEQGFRSSGKVRPSGSLSVSTVVLNACRYLSSGLVMG